MTLTGKRKILKTLLVFALVAIALLFTRTTNDREEVVLKVNDFSLTNAELEMRFEGEIVDQAEKEHFIENLIERKLLVQEALDRGFDRREEFLSELERFWEQSLIKIMVHEKMKELRHEVQADEATMRKYYQLWKIVDPEREDTFEEQRPEIEQRILRREKQERLDAWIKALRDNACIEIDRKAIFGETGEKRAD